MTDRLSQYLQILPWLVARPHVSMQEFMAEFNLTKKQAHTALRTLTFVGPDQGGGGLVDIDFEDGFIYVRNAQNFERPVSLNRLEASSLLGGLAYLKAVAGAENVERIDAIIAKISSAANKAGTPFEVIGQKLDLAVVSEVKSAIQDTSCLEIEYSDGTGNVSVRVIEPHCIEALNDVLYVAGWCQLKQASRTFRLDRMMRVTEVDVPSTNADRVRAQVEVVGSQQATVLATIEALEDFSSAHIISQTQQPDGRWLVELKVGSLSWLAGLILTNGGEMEAIAPDELRQEVLNRAKNWLGSSGNS